MLHRKIDSFTDAHPIVRQSKRRLHEQYGHFDGIIIDVFYDHFLAKNWNQFATTSLTQTEQDFLKLMDANLGLLPQSVKDILPYMKQQLWLSSYATKEGIQKVLNGINKRTKGKSKMDLAIADLELHYTKLEDDFNLFFADLRQYCKESIEEIFMDKTMYETERLLIRELKTSDINPFHEMHSNKNVMIYTDSGIKTYEEDVLNLTYCISCYSKKDNRFNIWAVVKKENNTFIGTVALIEYDKNNDEVGFRFLEKYWNNGYGFEVLIGLIEYAKQNNHKELFAEVYAKNIGSVTILKKAGFKYVSESICNRTNLVDCLFVIKL